jgi:ATP-binding cassette, subfamily B, bacterial
LTDRSPLWFTRTVTAGDLIIFLILTQRMVEPLTQMSEIVDRYEGAKASARRIFGLMSILAGITSGSDMVELDAVDGRGEYDHVDFAYDDGEQVLSDVTFTVAPAKPSDSTGRPKPENRPSANSSRASTT